MATLNTVKQRPLTHEGGKTKIISTEEKFKRTIMSCLLWEDTFYEDGESIASRIISYVKELDVSTVLKYAKLARTKYNLRHVPLLIIAAIFYHNKHKGLSIRKEIASIISRPDEMAELIKIWWKLFGDKKIPNQIKRAIADRFVEFNEYQIRKYRLLNKDLKLRDVMFLTHPKPKNKEQEIIFKKLADNELEAPENTWEVELSASTDKKASWEKLLRNKSLGSMALVKNLRNMLQAGVDDDLIINALREANYSKIFPYRFIAAYKMLKNEGASSKILAAIEDAMYKAISKYPKLKGKTIILIDKSGSMNSILSAGSIMKRIEAAAALGILIREIAEEPIVYSFNSSLTKDIPKMARGFGLYEILESARGNTYLRAAIEEINNLHNEYDRIIVITDEQSQDGMGKLKGKYNYLINVGSYENGIGYRNNIVHIDGFSTSVIEFIMEYENSLEG